MLKNIIEQIAMAASELPNVGQIVIGSPFRLNTIPETKYSVIIIEHTTSRQDGDWINIGVDVTYVDRLDDNHEDIHDTGVNALHYILTKLQDEYTCTATMNVFEQRFKDLTAGVIMNLQIKLPSWTCIEE